MQPHRSLRGRQVRVCLSSPPAVALWPTPPATHVGGGGGRGSGSWNHVALQSPPRPPPLLHALKSQGLLRPIRLGRARAAALSLHDDEVPGGFRAFHVQFQPPSRRRRTEGRADGWLAVARCAGSAAFKSFINQAPVHSHELLIGGIKRKEPIFTPHPPPPPRRTCCFFRRSAPCVPGRSDDTERLSVSLSHSLSLAPFLSVIFMQRQRIESDRQLKEAGKALEPLSGALICVLFPSVVRHNNQAGLRCKMAIAQSG